MSLEYREIIDALKTIIKWQTEKIIRKEETIKYLDKTADALLGEINLLEEKLKNKEGE